MTRIPGLVLKHGMRDCFDWVMRNLPFDTGQRLLEVWSRETPTEKAQNP